MVNLPIRLKGDSKHISGYTFSALAGQNKDFDAASQSLQTEVKLSLPRRIRGQARKKEWGRERKARTGKSTREKALSPQSPPSPFFPSSRSPYPFWKQLLFLSLKKMQKRKLKYGRKSIFSKWRNIQFDFAYLLRRAHQRSPPEFLLEASFYGALAV